MSRTPPQWLEPLLTNLGKADVVDFTSIPTPGDGGRPAAVLILLADEHEPGAGPDVLIMQRAATLRTHAGQPAFPGGAVDPQDADASATALREAQEEVGLDPDSVTVLAELGEDLCFAKHPLRWIGKGVLEADRPLELLGDAPAMAGAFLEAADHLHHAEPALHLELRIKAGARLLDRLA